MTFMGINWICGILVYNIYIVHNIYIAVFLNGMSLYTAPCYTDVGEILNFNLCAEPHSRVSGYLKLACVY